MSVLRLLAPSKPLPPGNYSTLPSTASSSKSKITIDIQLLTNGTILMDPPNDPLWPHSRSAGSGPTDDQLLNGVLEIQVPRGSTKRRCRSVKVGVRTRSKLNMGPGRGWEEDIFFERKVEMMDGHQEGIVLHEGMQRFEFTIIIPSTFAPHDRHLNGIVNQELFVELEGQPKPLKSSSPFNLFGRPGKRDKSTKSSRSSSRVASRSPSPTPHTPLSLSPVLAAVDSLSLAQQEQRGLPAVPSYNESQADPLGRGRGRIAGLGADDDWVIGLHEASRNIQVTHNPNPTGNYSDLDKSHNGFTDGLGVWDLKLMSDVFSVGSPFHARFTFPSPSPQTSIFYWRLRLRQTHTMTSPRDDPASPKPTTDTVFYHVADFGTKPPRGLSNPGTGFPALWRGKEAGGTSEGQLISEGNAFLPKHNEARPTTLPGVITPIQVSHALVCDVYMSVFGEDDKGGVMPKPGPGGLRMLHIVLPTILPGCSLIPAQLDAPTYDQVLTDKPCPECGHRSNAQICVTCAPSFIPHPRHDVDGPWNQEDGFCQTCLDRFGPCDPYEVEQCACRIDTADVEARMKRFWYSAPRDGRGADFRPNGRKL